MMNIRDLPINDRIQLVEDIWDSIAAEQHSIPVTDKQREELDRRLKSYELSGDAGVPAAESIERIRASL
jgi:putative addiction module component (TIGR02574 family)